MMNAAKKSARAQTRIKNILLDINGVLYDSGENHAIEGSVEAMNRLVEFGFNFCLVTNECTLSKRLLAKKLNNYGFVCVSPASIVSPGPVACRYLEENNLCPRLHVWPDIIEDFEPVVERMKTGCVGDEKQRPINCLVVGDVMDNITRDYLDESLELMLKSKEKPKLIGLGAGRYYKDAGRLRMDTGAYLAAYEYCLGVKAINLAKPSPAFFQEALDTLGAGVEDTVMIGDDIVSDVGGAQAMGMRGYLVRTGKYKPSDETLHGITADQTFDDLSQAVDELIAVCTKE